MQQQTAVIDVVRRQMTMPIAEVGFFILFVALLGLFG